MKRLIIFLILFSATTIAKAQQAGQLYITSYDDTGQIVYVCDGQPQGYVAVQFAMVNLIQSIPLTVDSVVPSGDTSVFKYLDTDRTQFQLGEFSGGTGAFAPTRVGDDTIHLTAYYNGKFTATAAIIFHARSAPDIAMYGLLITTAYTNGGNSFGGGNDGEVTDTMHDQMTASDLISGPYYVGSPPSENGGLFNEPVTLNSCGGAVIDSIYEVGDFSEFSFDSLPALPFTMPGYDSLIINYEFTPKVIDTLGIHHHYLIFHSTGGHYLVWSFEYYVYPTDAVYEGPTASDAIKVFPNPATDELQILGGPRIGDDAAGTIHLFDLMGRERMNANDDGTGATLDVSRLEPGIYFLREGTQSTKVEISR